MAIAVAWPERRLPVSIHAHIAGRLAHDCSALAHCAAPCPEPSAGQLGAGPAPAPFLIHGVLTFRMDASVPKLC